MIRRGLLIWSSYLIVCMTVAGTFFYLSNHIYTLEIEQKLAEEQRDREERLRLALWRMDSTLTSLLLTETFPISENKVEESPYIEESITLPTISIKGKTDFSDLAVLTEKFSAAPDNLIAFNNVDIISNAAPSQFAAKGPSPNINQQQGFQQRAENFQSQNRINTYLNNGQVFGAGSILSIGPVEAHWHGDNLYIGRTVQRISGSTVEAARINWAKTSEHLRNHVADILPNVTFLPVYQEIKDPNRDAYLATIPVRVIPNWSSTISSKSPSTILLAIAGACLLLSLVAFGFLIYTMMELEKRRREFVASVTHELRTPLTTFNLYTEMLLGSKLKDENKRRNYLETLSEESKRLSHLVENVLAYSRLERRGYETNVKEFELSESVEISIDRHRSHLERHDIHLLWNAPDEGIYVKGDPGVLDQILFNLLDNVTKYASSGKKVEISVQQRDKLGSLTVRDHGKGMPKDIKKRLFSPFSTSAQQAADRTKPGVGLGLNLSRRLARAIGGDLALIKSDNEGTEFEIRLPLK